MQCIIIQASQIQLNGMYNLEEPYNIQSEVGREIFISNINNIA